MAEAANVLNEKSSVYLSSEARAEAKKPASDVWSKAQDLLKGKDHCLLIPRNQNYKDVEIFNSIIFDKDGKSYTDLEIKRTVIANNGSKYNYEKRVADTIETFTFHSKYEGYVMKEITVNNGLQSVYEKHEVGKEGLEELLKTLMESRKIGEHVIG